MNPEEEVEEDAHIDLDSQRNGKGVVLKTSSLLAKLNKILLCISNSFFSISSCSCACMVMGLLCEIFSFSGFNPVHFHFTIMIFFKKRWARGFC